MADKLATHNLDDNGQVDTEFLNVYQETNSLNASVTTINTTLTTTPTISTGSTAPASTPTKVGDIYVNTSTGAMYISCGSAGSYNWGYVGTGGLSAWTSSNPAGLVSWYDANNGPTPAINGNTLTGWNDGGSKVNTLSNIVGTPKYYTGIQNGLPAIYFDGSSSLYGSNQADDAQPQTAFVVFKPTGWSTGTYQVVAAQSGTQYYLGKYTGNTNSYMYAGTAIQGASVTNNATAICTTILNGANSSIKFNADAATTGNAGTNANINYPSIGAADSASYRFTGYVMEFLVYNASLSASDQAIVLSYLNTKWAVY